MIDIIFALLGLVCIKEGTYVRLFSYYSVAFREYDKFVSWDVVFFNSLADDLLARAVGVDIRCVPSIQP